MGKEIIAMTRKELDRYETIKNLIAKAINGTDAAKLLNLSVRQVKRLKAGVKLSGANGVIHKLRGRESNRRTDCLVWQKAKDLIVKFYPDFGPTLAHEKLVENHRVKLGVGTIRNLMISEKIWMTKKRKQNKQYRSQRERKECFGELIQFDGCYHRWFENRNEECCLLSAIDDATSRPVKLKFTDGESITDVFGFWQEYIKRHGKPVAVYLDKFGTYKINHKNAKDNYELLTQFQRAANELGVNLITAHSPQAKGRVERPFATFQDRLVKELRLQKINNIEKANEFLESHYTADYGKRFGVVPKKKTDLHRALADNELKQLDAIFSVQATRQVKNDFTLQFKNSWYQLSQEQPVTVRRKEIVLIEERLDESLAIRLRGRYLNYRTLPAKPPKLKEIIPVIPGRRTQWKPAVDHPWRRQVSAQFAKVDS